MSLKIEIYGPEITGFTKLTAEHYGTTEEEELAYQLWRDKYKKQYALDNGYSYLEIPYWTETDDSYKELIDNKIKELNYQCEFNVNLLGVPSCILSYQEGEKIRDKQRQIRRKYIDLIQEQETKKHKLECVFKKIAKDSSAVNFIKSALSSLNDDEALKNLSVLIQGMKLARKID